MDADRSARLAPTRFRAACSGIRATVAPWVPVSGCIIETQKERGDPPYGGTVDGFLGAAQEIAVATSRRLGPNGSTQTESMDVADTASLGGSARTLSRKDRSWSGRGRLSPDTSFAITLLAAQTKRLARGWCMSGIENRITPDICRLLVSSTIERPLSATSRYRPLTTCAHGVQGGPSSPRMTANRGR
jgi:hypothetical protein